MFQDLVQRDYIYEKDPLENSVETANYRLAASIDQDWFFLTFVPV